MILDKIFKNEKGEFISIVDILTGNNDIKNYIYTLAEAHAIDLIAKTIAKCEIQTFENIKGKVQKNKGELYWTLNIQPNPNEKGTSFIYKLITKLLTDQKALILINKKLKTNYLYVADTFDTDNNILYGKTFNNITITDDEGNSLAIRKTYNSENSTYFSIKNDDLVKASTDFSNNTNKILKAIQKSFIRNNTSKWRLKNPGNQPTLIDPETKKPISYEEYKDKITEGLLSEEEAIVLLSEQFGLEELNAQNKANNKNSNDYESIFKKIGDQVAQKWNIPLDIFYGSKTEKSTGTNDFITFAVEPYFELLEDGFNLSLVGKESYLKGEYVEFNKHNITHRDILDSATGIDKLTSSRFSRNEINELLGLPLIDEDWANEHYITKNYANVKGGAEEDG